MTESPRRSFRIPPGEWIDLQRVASTQDTTAGDVIRRVIRAYSAGRITAEPLPRAPRGGGAIPNVVVRVSVTEWTAAHRALATENARRAERGARRLSLRDVVLAGIRMYLGTDTPERLPF